MSHSNRTPRRAVLAGAAAASADPIFAAIERHRSAYAAFDARLGIRQRREKARVKLSQSEEAQERTASEAEKAALDFLFATPARTLAGLKALVSYVGEPELFCHDEGYLLDGLRGSIGRTLSSISSPTEFSVETPSTAAAEKDAELLELGRRLDPLLAEWSKVVRAGDAESLKFERACFEATGIRPDDAPNDGEPGFAEYMRTRQEIIDRDREANRAFENAEEARHQEIRDRAPPLLRRILALRAQTLAGIAVKARAAAFMETDCWRDPEEAASAYGLDHPLPNLIENICEVAGVPSLASQTGSWDPARDI